MTINRRAINQEKERIAELERRQNECRIIASIELQRAIKELQKLQDTSPFAKLYDVAIGSIERIIAQLQEKEL